MKQYKNTASVVMDYERNQIEWWLRHHKHSVQYFCIRVSQMLEAEEKGDMKKFEWYLKHFKAVLPAFANSVQFDLEWDEGGEEE